MKRKIKLLLLIIIAVFSMITITACANDDNNNVEITQEYLEGLKFEGKTVNYDGGKHSIFIENVPEGVDVKYIGNGQTFPGEYNLKAILTYGKITVKKSAMLIIVGPKTVLTAEDNQVLFIYGNKLNPIYTIDNSEQKVEFKYYHNGVEVPHNALTTPGTYEVDIIATETAIYKETVKRVTVTTTNSNLGVSYADKEVSYDGTSHTITLDGPDLEAMGYTVEYTNNVGTETGMYKALAKVKDSSGNVVETHAAILNIVNPDNEEFNQFLDKFFVEYLEEDQLSVNIFCEKAVDFGLKHYDAKWYEYKRVENDEDATEETKNLAHVKDLLAELEAFDDDRLSKLQRIAYNNVEDALVEIIDSYEVDNIEFMNLHYIDQFGGYVADFSTYMEAYSLYSEQEVKDLVSYITSTETAFPSYLDYLEDRTSAGYALSDFTINEMRSYLFKIYTGKNGYYLGDVLGAKIDAVRFLNEEEKAKYKDEIKAALAGSFMNGVKALHDGLGDYLGTLDKEDEGYLSTYEGGKEYYFSQLKSLLGLKDLDPETYAMEIDRALSKAVSSYSSYQNSIVSSSGVTTWDELLDYIAQFEIYSGTPQEMMVYLKEFAATIVPELTHEPDIDIKYMDDISAEASSAVAYYMKSALDNTGSENITLNPKKLGDKNDVLSTLAHEGYPGHLYAYVNSKEIGLHNLSVIMTSTAHAEGWATYVSVKLYEYAIANSEDAKFIEVMEYLKSQELMGFLFETRLDFGIHYEGWKAEEIYKLMSKLGYIYGDEAHYEEDMQSVNEVFYQMIEMPTTYAAYGYGKEVFMRLHNEAKEILGCYYDEVEFNTMLHSCGWINLGELQKVYEEYMEAKCHKAGIEYAS